MNGDRRAWLAASAAAVASASTAIVTTNWMRSDRRDPERTVPALKPALPTGRQPLNVLLIVSSQERFALPPSLPLPGHDRLREKGTRFTQWHANNGARAPARATLYFGQHTQKTGILSEPGMLPSQGLPPDMPSLGHYFRANGYTTALKGRWQLSPVPAVTAPVGGRYPHARDALEPYGFADFQADGEPSGGSWAGYQQDARIAAEATQWLLGRGQGARKPWLLAVNFINPSDVRFLATDAAQIGSQRFTDYGAPLALPPVDPLYLQRWDVAVPGNRSDDLSRKPWIQRRYRDFINQAFGRVDDSEAAWKIYQDHYFNAIRDVDRHLLTVLDALQASGQADRTVVVYTSDLGEMAGAHGLRQHGPLIYQESTRVPMIVRHPDATSARSSGALGSAVDLVPTLLELAGCDPKLMAQAYPQLTGVSLAQAVARPETRTERDERGILFNGNDPQYNDIAHLSALLDRQVPIDRHLALRSLAAGLRPWSRREHPTMLRGIHTGRFKFARYFKPAEHHRPAEWDMLTRHNSLELYDLQGDPGELDNLAHAPEWARQQVLELNSRLNALTAKEIGPDLGDEHGGPAFLNQL